MVVGGRGLLAARGSRRPRPSRPARPHRLVQHWPNLRNPPPAPQNAKNCLREGALARFLDVVVWGHEHECIQEPWESAEAAAAFSVMQPGSSGEGADGAEGAWAEAAGGCRASGSALQQGCACWLLARSTPPQASPQQRLTWPPQSPPSTRPVATALSEGESKRKHCVMLEVLGHQVRCTGAGWG